METKVLKTILESKSDYFVVETYFNYYDSILYKYNEERGLILISLPVSLNRIRYEKNIDTITFKEVEMFKITYIENNIYISPKYPPFQKHVNFLSYAVDCLPLEEDFDLAELLSADLKTIKDVKKYFSNRKSLKHD